MKKALCISILAAMLSTGTPVLAENAPFSASVGVTGSIAEVKGNEAKFNEYRDVRDGVYGNVELSYDKGSYFMNLSGRDFGYDTQRYRFEGGRWGQFKYDFYYRESPHNISYGAVSPYSGAGTGNLTFDQFNPFAPADTWTGYYDYSTLRKQYGGSISIDAAKPFFFTFGISREDRSGIKPAGVAITGSGFPSLELPEPVDYITNMLSASAGYSRNPLFLSFDFHYSNFENGNHALNFMSLDSTPGNIFNDALTLPPDNSYYKFGFKGSLKLPLNSRFSVNLSRSRATSDAALLSSYYNFGAIIPITLSDSTFDGKVITTRADVVLSGNPVSFLDAKLFMKYYDRDNKSDRIIVDNDPTTANDLLSYQKNTFGGELGFRLPARFYLSTGYSYVNTDRSRKDLADTRDRIFTAGLKWRGVDFMTAGVGYENLHRNASFHQESESRNYDLASKDRNTIKLSADFFPMENLNFSLGYKYKIADYKGLTYGLTEDKRDEFNVSADYMIGKIAQLFAYWDYEQVRSQQSQSAFLWDLAQKEKNYDYGIGTNIYIIPKTLTLRLQYDYTRSNGNGDLTVKDPNGLTAISPDANNHNIDLGNWDDYRKRSYLVKLMYDATKKLSVAVAYAYEKYTYTDLQLDNYAYIPDFFGSNGAFLSGAYKDQSYKANVFFTTVTYRLW